MTKLDWTLVGMYIVAIVAVIIALAVIMQPATVAVNYQPKPNGDYSLIIRGSQKALVCEEQSVVIVQQPDAVNPLVIECRHGEK